MAQQFGLRIIIGGLDKGLTALREHNAIGQGKAGWADICVPEQMLSGGKHFYIEWDDKNNSHILIDLRHPNRISLNGQPIEGGQTLPLCDGDEISIGNTVMRYEAIS